MPSLFIDVTSFDQGAPAYQGGTDGLGQAGRYHLEDVTVFLGELYPRFPPHLPNAHADVSRTAPRPQQAWLSPRARVASRLVRAAGNLPGVGNALTLIGPQCEGGLALPAEVDGAFPRRIQIPHPDCQMLESDPQGYRGVTPVPAVLQDSICLLAGTHLSFKV